MKGKSIMAVDVGSGTQDILIYDPGEEMENNPKLILPSQTQIVAKRIRELTQTGENIFLHGHLMGGGATTKAVQEHLKAGLKVYATENAALTFKDDLRKVEGMGVKLTESPPSESVPVYFQDIDVVALRTALSYFGVGVPDTYAFAVQDHGFAPEGSNRAYRFQHWEGFLNQGGQLFDLIFDDDNLPDYFTRMRSVKEASQGRDVIVTDTGIAAIIGALEDEQVSQAVNERGAVLVNVGNQHTIAFLLAGQRVLGVFEHHTGKLSPDTLGSYLERFKRGQLSQKEVLEDRGHGCMCLPEALHYPWEDVFVTGPRRSMGQQLGVLAVPHGDMMLTGAFGLVRGVKERKGWL